MLNWLRVLLEGLSDGVLFVLYFVSGVTGMVSCGVLATASLWVSRTIGSNMWVAMAVVMVLLVTLPVAMYSIYVITREYMRSLDV